VSADANAAAITAASRLKRRALTLGVARGFDYAIALLLPIALVRYLDPQAFGQYRLLWLVVGTVMAVATLAMPASLFYFLPRSDSAATRRLYVNQTLFYLAASGIVSGIAVGPWNHWLPENVRALSAHGLFVPTFVLLWVMASLLDLLPSVDERVRWQAKVTIGLGVLRAAGLSVAAILTRDLAVVFVVLLAFVIFKLILLLAYIAKHHGLLGPILRWQVFTDQLKYAAPFGTGGALYALRSNGDQWVAATFFPVAMFASFSIAAVLAPLLHVFRQAISAAFLPSMSRFQADGDVGGALDLNSRANVMTASIVYPLLAYAFVFAEDLVAVVYTEAYLDAVPVMRLYVAGLVAMTIELTTVTLLLRQGVFVLGLNWVTLPCSLALSWYAALRFGLPGAAVGSVAAAYVDRVLTLRRISRLTGVPVARQQDWAALARLLLYAALIAALARFAVITAFDRGELRLVVGGGALAAGYGLRYLWLRTAHGRPSRRVRDGV
jgi:O-antigen/teichoic acid export membrane protein